jgi:L,D-peptidoglycan transpeptidase YkuD (ErfK/YbiS/YcfS/YnhG family)
VRAIAREDGWCDDPGDPAYNQPVRLPFAARHERLWRRGRVYDLIVPLGYNDDPITPRRGSAIFLHVARRSYLPTEGCVALSRPDLLDVLTGAGPGARVVIDPR